MSVSHQCLDLSTGCFLLRSFPFFSYFLWRSRWVLCLPVKQGMLLGHSVLHQTNILFHRFIGYLASPSLNFSPFSYDILISRLLQSGLSDLHSISMIASYFNEIMAREAIRAQSSPNSRQHAPKQAGRPPGRSTTGQ